MKEGLEQLHAKSLAEFFEKRQLHPIDALRVMSITSMSILAGYIEYDLSAEERTRLAEDIDSFAGRLRELLHTSEEELFPILISVQMLNRELLESAVQNLKEAAKELANQKKGE